MGRWWWLVTLDDHEVSAIGVDEGTRRLVTLAGFGSMLAKAGFRVGVVIVRVVAVAWMILVGIVVIDALGKPDVGEALLLALVRYVTLLTDTIDAGHLVQPFGPDSNTAFVILAAISAVGVIGAIVAVPILLHYLPLMIPLGFFNETIDAVRKAEASRTRVINSGSQVAAAAASIASDSRGIFAPRLVVLTVSSAFWQETVRKLAAGARRSSSTSQSPPRTWSGRSGAHGRLRVEVRRGRRVFACAGPRGIDDGRAWLPDGTAQAAAPRPPGHRVHDRPTRQAALRQGAP